MRRHQIFDDFMAEVEAEAHAEGPDALAELEAFQRYFRREAAELSSLVERLARTVRPTHIPVWLNKPIPALDDDKPIERIASGDYRSVARLISGLEDPGAS
jgi:hypothetical protein